MPTTAAHPQLDSLHSTAADSEPAKRSAPQHDTNDVEEDDFGLDELEDDEGIRLDKISPRREGGFGHDEGEEEEEEEPIQVNTFPGEDEYDSEDDSHAALTGRSGKRRRRAMSAQSFELYTPDEERAVLRKLDTRLALFVALLYMMSFLDRSNIGNAKVAGLTRDLHLSDDQFEWLLTAFYIAYITFEWMTLCYKIFPAHIYISCCVLAWGIIASCQSLVTSFPAMLVLRALLGIGEAAFVGIPFYLSFFYRRNELAFRIGLFISAAPLATSFASMLAYAIVKFGDSTSIANWRLLFLVEGFPACIIAFWTWYWIPDSPATTRWLSARERRIASLRMRKEASTTSSPASYKAHISSDQPHHKQPFQWQQVLNTLLDPKSYLTAGMFFACNVAFSSMPVFLPTIINAMGYSRLASQAISAPPFLFAFIVVLFTAWISDRTCSRSVPMLVHALLAAGGYAFLALCGVFKIEAFGWRYAAVFPICAGFFSAVTIVITWTVNNQPSDEGKGTGMAVLNVIGQLGPLLGTRLYPDSEGPYFVKGMSVCAVAMGVVAVLAVALRLVLRRENSKLMKRRGFGRDAFVYIT